MATRWHIDLELIAVFAQETSSAWAPLVQLQTASRETTQRLLDFTTKAKRGNIRFDA
jgi:hypothetical protein